MTPLPAGANIMRQINTSESGVGIYTAGGLCRLDW